MGLQIEDKSILGSRQKHEVGAKHYGTRKIFHSGIVSKMIHTKWTECQVHRMDDSQREKGYGQKYSRRDLVPS